MSKYINLPKWAQHDISALQNELVMLKNSITQIIRLNNHELATKIYEGLKAHGVMIENMGILIIENIIEESLRHPHGEEKTDVWMHDAVSKHPLPKDAHIRFTFEKDYIDCQVWKERTAGNKQIRVSTGQSTMKIIPSATNACFIEIEDN